MSRTGIALVVGGLAAFKGAASVSWYEPDVLPMVLFLAGVVAVAVGGLMLAGVKFRGRFTVGGPGQLAAAAAFVLAFGSLVGAFVADHDRERDDYQNLLRGDRAARADRTPVYILGAGSAFFVGVGLVCVASHQSSIKSSS